LHYVVFKLKYFTNFVSKTTLEPTPTVSKHQLQEKYGEVNIGDSIFGVQGQKGDTENEFQKPEVHIKIVGNNQVQYHIT
jgi:hypothetical protein